MWLELHVDKVTFRSLFDHPTPHPHLQNNATAILELFILVHCRRSKLDAMLSAMVKVKEDEVNDLKMLR